MRIVSGFQPLTVVTKSSILDAAGVPNPLLVFPRLVLKSFLRLHFHQFSSNFQEQILCSDKFIRKSSLNISFWPIACLYLISFIVQNIKI